jgi:hypothetical protein
VKYICILLVVCSAVWRYLFKCAAVGANVFPSLPFEHLNGFQWKETYQVSTKVDIDTARLTPLESTDDQIPEMQK